MELLSKRKRILHVRLPCWKIFPSGTVYLANHLKSQGYTDQRIFDLALVEPADRRRELRRVMAALSPDIVAFSWRNIQTFGPHDASPALETVLKYDHSNHPLEKISSLYEASSMIVDHIQQIRYNLGFIRQAFSSESKPQVVVGGPAFSIFPDKLIKRLPAGVIGVVGEGESALTAIVEEGDLSRENVIYLEGGKVRRFHSDGFFDLGSVGPVDFKYINSIWPEMSEYAGGFIGLQTKRGCPFGCTFCIYNCLEGKKLRFKNPTAVADEIEQLKKYYKVNKIWFTDSQFCSTNKTISKAEELLDEIIGRKLRIGWTGYIRVENLTESFARKAQEGGILSFELSFAGSQKMIDILRLGYKLSKQMEKFMMIKELGYSGQQVKLYLPLNAPGESRETLLETIKACKDLYKIFGEENVVPWIFFLAIQPGTDLEEQMIESGYLKRNYNPLSYNPFMIKRLLHNPPPLGPLIGNAYLSAKRQSEDFNIGRETLNRLEKNLTSKT